MLSQTYEEKNSADSNEAADPVLDVWRVRGFEAAKEYLGWSVVSSASGQNRYQKASQVFVVSDADVAVSNTRLEWSVGQTNDIKAVDKTYDMKFGANLNLAAVHSSLGPIGGSYESIGSDNQNNAHCYTVITLWKRSTFTLNKTLLPLQSKVTEDDFREGYIGAGEISSLCQIVIDTQLDDHIVSQARTTEFSAEFFGGLLKPYFHNKSGNGSTNKQHALNIRFQGTVAIAPIMLNAENLDESIAQLVRQIHANMDRSGRVISFSNEDIKLYRLSSVGKQYQRLINVIDEIKERLPKSITAHADMIATWGDNLRAEIERNFNQLSKKPGYEDVLDDQAKVILQREEALLRLIALRLGQDIDRLLVNGFAANSDHCHIKVSGARDLELVVEEDGLFYKQASFRTFKIEVCPDQLGNVAGQRRFHLLTDEGLYICASQDQKTLIVSDTVEDAGVWSLDSVPDVPGYRLILDGQSLMVKRPTQLIGVGEPVELVNIHASSSAVVLHFETSCAVHWIEEIKQTLNDYPALPPDVVPGSSTKEDIDKAISKAGETAFAFVRRVIPSLSPAQGKSLVFVIGNAGVGKSTFINYMLGHLFEYQGIEYLNEDGITETKEILAVKGKPSIFAPMGDGMEGVTQYPACYSTESLVFTDCPGFQDPNVAKRAQQAFSMFLVKEMAQEVKALVIMLSHEKFTRTDVDSLVKVLTDLHAVVKSSESASRSITFVVSTKGLDQRAGNEKLVLGKVLQCKKWFSDDTASYKMLFERAQSSGQSPVREQEVQRGGIANAAMGLIARLWRGDPTASPAALDQLTRQENAFHELPVVQQVQLWNEWSALSILNLMKISGPDKNVFAWGSGIENNDPQQRPMLTQHLRVSPGLSKEALRFDHGSDGIPSFSEKLQSSIQHYSLKLGRIAAQRDSQKTRLRSFKIDELNADLGRVDRDMQTLQAEMLELFKKLAVCSMHLRDWDTEVFIENLEVEGKIFRGGDFFSANWYPKSSLHPRSSKSRFTSVTDKIPANLVKVEKSEKWDSVQHHRSVARQRANRSWMSGDELYQNYLDYGASYQRDWKGIWSDIAHKTVVGELRGRRRDVNPSEADAAIRLLSAELEELTSNIKKYWKKLKRPLHTLELFLETNKAALVFGIDLDIPNQSHVPRLTKLITQGTVEDIIAYADELIQDPEIAKRVSDDPLLEEQIRIRLITFALQSLLKSKSKISSQEQATVVPLDRAVKNEISRIKSSIAQLRQNLDEAYEELRDNQDYFQEAYASFKPLQAILKHADVRMGDGRSELLTQLDYFIKLCDRAYDFYAVKAKLGAQMHRSLMRWEKSESFDTDLHAALEQSKKAFAESEGNTRYRGLIEAYGFSMHDVPPDGNCFFHALYDQLNLRYPNILQSLEIIFGKSSLDHHDLRRLAVGGLVVLAQRGDIVGSDIEKLIDGASEDGAWADGVIIPTIARALGITIVLVNSTAVNQTTVIDGGRGGVIYLGYQVGIHFQSLHGGPGQSLLAKIQQVHRSIPPSRIDMRDAEERGYINDPVLITNRPGLVSSPSSTVACLSKSAAAAVSSASASSTNQFLLSNSSSPALFASRSAPTADVGSASAVQYHRSPGLSLSD